MALIPTATSLTEWPRLGAYRVHVTPDMAREWLDVGNVDNRTLRHAVVRRYADLMKRGEWRPTHQGVAFSARRLIDGQHRLTAIVESGVAQWMIVFVDQPDDTYGVLDRGAVRLLRDDMTDLPRHSVDALSFLAQIAGDRKTRTADPKYVLSLRDALGPTLMQMHNIATGNKKTRTAAPIRAAVAIRHAIASKEQAAYIDTQWRAWVNFDPQEMSPSISSLCRRLENAGVHQGRVASNERAAIAWIGFDPDNRNLSKVLLRDQNKTIEELRAAVLELVPAS